MKKLFVSCPMNGRADEAIKESIDRLHKLAEVITGEQLELINSYVPKKVDFPEGTQQHKISIWYLAQSLNKLKDADIVIGARYLDCFAGCGIELEVSRAYGIKTIYVGEDMILQMMPDVEKIQRERWKSCDALPVGGEKL